MQSNVRRVRAGSIRGYLRSGHKFVVSYRPSRTSMVSVVIVDALTISIATVATTTFIVTVTEATMIGYVDFRSHFRINPAIPYLLCSTFLSKASVTRPGLLPGSRSTDFHRLHR